MNCLVIRGVEKRQNGCAKSMDIYLQIYVHGQEGLARGINWGLRSNATMPCKIV